MDMETNFWYYSFSTIAQTLAAVVAVFFTFIIFKLSVLQSAIEKQLELLKIVLLSLHPDQELEIDKFPIKKIAEKIDKVFLTLDKSIGQLGLTFEQYTALKNVFREIDSFWVRGNSNEEVIWNFVQKNNDSFKRNIKERKTIHTLALTSLIVNFSPIILSLVLLPRIGLYLNDGVATEKTHEIVNSVTVMAVSSLLTTGTSIGLILF